MPWDIWLIFFVLGLILPWRGRVRMKKLLAMPYVGTMQRLTLYASTIAFQWFAVAVVAWRAWAHGFTASQFGLTIHDRTRILVASIVGAATIAALQWLNLRSEEHTSELQSHLNLVCRLLLEKKKKKKTTLMRNVQTNMTHVSP